MKKGRQVSTTGKMWILRLAERAGGAKYLAYSLDISIVMLWKITTGKSGLSDPICKKLISYSEGFLTADDFYENTAMGRNRVLTYIFMPFLKSLKKPKNAELAEAFQLFIDYLYDDNISVDAIKDAHIEAISLLFRTKKSFIKKLLTKEADIL